MPESVPPAGVSFNLESTGNAERTRCAGLGDSNGHQHFVLWKTHLFGRGEFISGGAVTGGGGNDGAQALFVEAEDFVVLRGVDAFHGASIDAEESGAVEEIAEGQVNLAGGPGIAAGVVEAVDNPAGHNVAVG